MKIFKFLHKRVFWVVLAILLQVGWMLLMFTRLIEYSEAVNAVLTLLSCIAILYIVNKVDNPAYKLAWAIPILAFPLLGGLTYLMFGDKRPSRTMRGKMDKAMQWLQPLKPDGNQILKQIETEEKTAYRQMKYINDCAGFPAYDDTESCYYKSGEECFPVLLEELKKAKHFIFMEYFIVKDGVMWEQILEVLKKKAAEGVDVRFIYDDMMACLNQLPHKYYRQLEEYGIKCEAFNHVIPFVSLVMNHRDHRKITVIDGHTGFMSGWNLADEYINEENRFGYWKDTGVMLRGEAVRNLTIMFLSTWYGIRGHDRENPKKFLPSMYLTEEVHGEGYVQPYGDTPLDRETVSESVYLNMINAAQDYIYMTTPYLVIDNEMITALVLAAKRGIDVRIVTPGIPDKRYVFWLTQSYYQQLVEAGVKIYQFTPGFVHAKSFVCDDRYAIVGTINMDFRSLYLHFECGTFFYKTPVVPAVREDILEVISRSTQQTLEMTQKGLPKHMAQLILRLFAPLL